MEWCRCRKQPPPLTDEILNGGCYKHTYIDKDGRRKPTQLLIQCREFIRMSLALQEKMRTEAANSLVVPGAISFGAPPTPPLPNTQQQGLWSSSIISNPNITPMEHTANSHPHKVMCR
jgi:hypothetical protein